MYFFSSDAYAKSTFETIELTEIFRQTGEDTETFIKLLNMVREGENVKTVKYLNSACRTDEPDGIVLCGSNAKAEEINEFMLGVVDGECFTFLGEAQGKIEESDYPVPVKLDVKIGAEVMIVKNIYTAVSGDDTPFSDLMGSFEEVELELALVNGDRGKITAIDPKGSITILCERTGEEHTIFKDQWDKEATFYDKKTKELKSTVIGSYIHFPLKLAYASTIHKSQGASFHKMTLDMTTRMFMPGQLYVALSRCTNLEGLSILGELKKSDVKTCPIVQAFMKDKKSYVGFKAGGIYDHTAAIDIFKAREAKRLSIDMI
jgi:ATP-dependent DNA helicase PIF1